MTAQIKDLPESVSYKKVNFVKLANWRLKLNKK